MSCNVPHLHTTHFSINIFEEDGFCSPNIIAEPIRTRIHAYLTREERDLYVPNTFFYVDGRSPLLCPGHCIGESLQHGRNGSYVKNARLPQSPDR